jgi:hypothetical protein
MPLPSSLMPGPSSTLSRCAPAMATRSAGAVSAMTLSATRTSETVRTRTAIGPPRATRAAAGPVSANTGMPTPGPPSVACTGSSSSSSTTAMPPAPARCAASAFARNGQVPRLTIARSRGVSSP